MNYLAHLFLARDNTESLIGNLAGDFVKGPLTGQFPAAIREGIGNHRRIDAFTDSHAEVAAFRRVLTPEFGHYARIISDVFFDHFLAVEWDRWRPGEPLDAFLARVFALMDTGVEAMPVRLREVYPHMRDGRWFRSYAGTEGIHHALKNLSFRLSRRPHLELATRHLVDSREVLLLHWHAFFAELVETHAPWRM